MPDPIDVTFELVTPAYAGGADRAKTDGLRPPTLKALLRFWWRAMHPEMDSERLFEEEEAIFGSTTAGQGTSLRPRGNWPAWQVAPAGTRVTDDWHVYAAYGAVAWSRGARAQVTQIARLNPGQSIAASLHAPAAAGRGPGPEDELRRSLWLLSAFGGIGSRSRRSWGSLRVVGDLGPGLVDVHADATNAPESIAEGLSTVFSHGQNGLPAGGDLQHTAFSRDARVLVGPEKDSWEAASRECCSLYHTYRKRLGKNRGGGRPGPDYAMFVSLLRGGASPPAAFEGIAFGAPNNRESRAGGGRVDAGVGSDLKGRRASPLFLKVIGSAGHFRPLVLWLPAEYLPGGMSVYMSRGGRSVAVADPGCAPVEQFFDGRIDVDPVWGGLGSEPGWQEVTW